MTFGGTDAERDVVDGSVVLCGARDERDAPAVAIAGAMAAALGLPLRIVHVIESIRPHTGSAAGVPPAHGLTPDDWTAAAALLERVAAAAGVELGGEARGQVVDGAPAAVLADRAARTDAALVVVGAPRRSRLRRMLVPSVARHLARRCERPVLLCPRDPAPALRLRAALEA